MQVKVIEQNMKQSPYPIIVCGDFNDTPLSYTYNKIKSNLIDSFTISGSELEILFKIPMLRIDYIFHDNKFKSYNYQKQKKLFQIIMQYPEIDIFKKKIKKIVIFLLIMKQPL